MKQVLQDLRSGQLLDADVAAPSVKPGHVLIRTSRSLISAGTERMLTNFAKANYLEKARQQPERVRQVFDKIRSDGLMAAYEAVSARLDEPIPLGYCNVGRVLAVGKGVDAIKPGDRVVSNSPHVEIALAPKNLCAVVPEGVDDDCATFVVVSAIALQGIRLAAPTLGETIVVFGLGLIGLLAVQILKANGCKVIGFDFNKDRVAWASSFGARAFDLSGGTDPVAAVLQETRGVGADGVLITAATDDNALISQAARMSRKRGRIVLTGVVGLDLKRDDFYEKELSLQVSCSYGPGRYDTSYELTGQDYPIGFVRWTEKRNFEAVLTLMEDGRLDVAHLITDRVAFSEARKAYDLLDSPRAIGVLLDYSNTIDDEALRARTLTRNLEIGKVQGQAIGVIGAGAFTRAKILPSLRKASANVKGIVSSNGRSGAVAARKFAIQIASTDPHAVLTDPEIAGIVVATPHNSHASLVISALQAGKHTLVEKPLCVSESELDAIIEARSDRARSHGNVPGIMVGFNRRYAPLAARMRDMAAGRNGCAFATYAVNAGALPPDHWTQDLQVGGGRIIGEACHFIDFLQFLIGSPVKGVQALKQHPQGRDLEDNVSISLTFADGSLGQVNYYSVGNKSYPKECCNISFDGKTAVLDNFRDLKGYGLAGSKKSLRQNKGHDEEFATFVSFVNGSTPLPVEFEVIENVMRATFAAVQSMRTGAFVSV